MSNYEIGCWLDDLQRSNGKVSDKRCLSALGPLSFIGDNEKTTDHIVKIITYLKSWRNSAVEQLRVGLLDEQLDVKYLSS